MVHTKTRLCKLAILTLPMRRTPGQAEYGQCCVADARPRFMLANAVAKYFALSWLVSSRDSLRV